MWKNVNWCVSPRRKSHQFHADLQLSNNTLEETSKFRDLGLVTTSKLSWNAHVDKISSKANKILGLVKRTCRGLNNATTLRTLYCALVRSHLDYCTVVWSPRCVDKLERIQRRATKLILKTDNEYDTRRERLNLLSLFVWCFVVVFFYKILNGYINIEISLYIEFYSDSERNSLRRRDELTLKKNYARTNTFKFSFFIRIVAE